MQFILEAPFLFAKPFLAAWANVDPPSDRLRGRRGRRLRTTGGARACPGGRADGCWGGDNSPAGIAKMWATDVSTDTRVRTNVGTAWFTRPHVNSRVKGPAASFCAPAAAPKCSSVAVAIAAKPTAVMAVPTMLGAKISARPASVTKRAPEAGQFMPPGHVAIALDKRA